MATQMKNKKRTGPRKIELTGLDKIPGLVERQSSPDHGPLQKGKSVALYQQVKNYIIDMIESGQWQPEMKLPSENELIEALGIARMTVHRALRELTIEGYLKRAQGLGTFIARPKQISGLLEIKPISEEIAQRDETHSSEVHLVTTEKCTPELAWEMGLATGSPVYRSIIVHKANGVPIQLADRYVNPEFAPDYLKQNFLEITPSQYLFQQGPLTRAEHVVEAIMPDKKIRQWLKMGSQEPCLLVQRKTWSARITVTKARLIYPGSRFKLIGNFQPNSGKSSVVG